MTASNTVRTRFAPSPTGALHIGSARTALFGWLLARHAGGQFVLRIEDTDQKRYVAESEQEFIDMFAWLGIDFDESPQIGGDYGPYRQSERLDHYQKWAQWLIDHDKAYRAYDTPEELAAINEQRRADGLPPGYDRRHRELTAEQEQAFIDEGRVPVVRFKVPLTGKVVVNDLVQGHIEFDNSTLQDIVLLKSDGFPTYHLAHVIDDHLMQISHVTRSNEWVPSLPVHVHLWHAFGWELPQYAHLPVLLNPNGKGKLSKRHAGFSESGKQVLVLVKEFREAGYLPEAVINFLTNIGWNFGDEREVFDIEEAIERFDIGRVNPANSAYPIEKLDWLNGVYIREKMSAETLAGHLRKPLEQAGLNVDEATLQVVAPLVQTRIKTLNDVVDLAGFFFKPDFTPASADDLIQRKMDTAGMIAMLQHAEQRLKTLDDWQTDALHSAMLTVVEELGLKNGQVFGGLRVAVTGQKVSTPTFESMEIIGRDESLRRIQQAINILQAG
ncbi:MAG: glutamate--tRNA ligase [Anaerolineaceae bacterium]|nr:MAG: glutamate--tRNA ligase [Anaerolineaceae bacterium]